MLAGSISGVCQVMTVQPFDLVKVLHRLLYMLVRDLKNKRSMPVRKRQTFVVFVFPLPSLNLLAQVRLQQAGASSGAGPVQTARHIWRTEGGLRAFYKGTSSMLLLIPVSNALMFSSYGLAQSFARSINASSSASPPSPTSRLPMHQYFACGAFAGCVASISYCPQELVKIRLQMDRAVVAGARPQYAGMVDCVRQIVRLEGVRGLYRGLGATLARDIPATGAWYGGYEAARSVISGGQEKPAPWINAVSGSCGGICYWLFGFPQDVAKSRIQTSPLPPAQRPSTRSHCPISRL